MEVNMQEEVLETYEMDCTPDYLNLGAFFCRSIIDEATANQAHTAEVLEQVIRIVATLEPVETLQLLETVMEIRRERFRSSL
tara:strand:- start:299 stop:544 length:246 start_codon:yes stop_codon:yes gene_type:complete